MTLPVWDDRHRGLTGCRVQRCEPSSHLVAGGSSALWQEVPVAVGLLLVFDAELQAEISRSIGSDGSYQGRARRPDAIDGVSEFTIA